ncbi:MAG: carbohydrate binding domain-containing protein, partial [Verrucomicrobia bacterium]|nr:carbohydrate binding domain-containing protein [Verrucomicrobiota bacterium]
MPAAALNRAVLVLCCLVTGCWAMLAKAPDAAGAPSAQLLTNGDFEKGLEGWDPLWAQEAGTAKAVLDTAERHGGAQTLRIQHTGRLDWSLKHSLELKVQPGDIYELTAWVRVRGAGTATLGVVTRDATGKTLDWAYAGRSTAETKGWRVLRSRFVVPPGATTIWTRLIGDGPATVWCDDFFLTWQGSLAALRGSGLPTAVTLSNAAMEVTLQTSDGTFAVRDHRTNRTWSQRADGAHLVVLDARADGGAIDLRLLDPVSMREIAARARLDGDSPELVVALRAEGKMDAVLAWPAAFASAKGQLLILPVNEGISYPTDDESLPPMRYHLYGGHGLCMPWYGAVEGDTGWMTIIETPDDAAVSIPRREGLLGLVPEWEPQKQLFGPERVIRYVFLDGGGYVAMARRYREYAKQTGLFKTLNEKRKSVPAVDLLVGAVNIWCWDQDAAAWCRELRACGIQRILWSNALPPDQIKTLNDLGVLTSRYDIYQDAMNPENLPRLRWKHPDWTSEAWTNDDLMIGSDGQWLRGWEVETKDGKMVPCGTLCDRQAVTYAKQRMPADLSTHPYRCRFIDTTTASPWRECYHPKHPMTRTESKRFKMDL